MPTKIEFELSLSPASRQVVRWAGDEARSQNRQQVTPEDFFLALINGRRDWDLPIIGPRISRLLKYNPLMNYGVHDVDWDVVRSGVARATRHISRLTDEEGPLHLSRGAKRLLRIAEALAVDDVKRGLSLQLIPAHLEEALNRLWVCPKLENYISRYSIWNPANLLVRDDQVTKDRFLIHLD